MEIKVVRQPDSVVESTVIFTSTEWAKAKEKAFKKIASTLNVPGFRKGFVPDLIAKQHIKPDQITNEAVNALLQPAYEASLKEIGSEPILQPNVRMGEMAEDKLSLIFTITVRPDVKLGKYQGITIEGTPISVSEEEVHAELLKLQKTNSMMMIKENGLVEQGNVVVLDFEGFVEGKPFEGGKAEKYELEIGSNSFVPGFESQLVGMKANTDSEIKVKFPENYVKDLAGKEATFKVKIHEIKDKVLPELNDELAVSANIPGVATLAELKNHYHEELEHQKAHDAENKALEKLIQTIANGASLELPKALVEEETKHAFDDYKKRIESNGLTFDQYLQMSNTTVEKVENDARINSINNLKTMFVLNEIAKQNNITVTEEDVTAELQKIADQYKMDLGKVKTALKDRMNEVRNEVFNRKVNDYLLANNSIPKAH